MELDIKNLGDQDMKQLVKSLELFAEWVGCLGGELTRAVEEKGAINPDELAKTIGVTPATVISLALALHREGAIKITELKAEPSNGVNTEICGCLRQN